MGNLVGRGKACLRRTRSRCQIQIQTFPAADMLPAGAAEAQRWLIGRHAVHPWLAAAWARSIAGILGGC